MKYTVTALTLLASMHALAEDEVKPFTMDGEFGLIVTTGNTETSSMAGKLTAHQELERWSNDYLIEGLYNQDEKEQDDGTSETETTAQKYFLSAQGNYKLENPDNRLFIFGSYEDDRFSNFKFQSTIAAGWSQIVWKSDVSKFEYSVGPGYSVAETQEGEDANSGILRASLDYKWNVSDTAVFTQTLSTEIGSDNTKSKSVTALSAKINGALSMKLSLTMDHNSDVADDRDNLDTQTAVTLVYTFF